jgi:hypothetical protein
MAILNSLLQCCIKTDLVNETKTCSRNLKANPTTLLYIVELLAKEVYIKAALCAML